MPRVLRILKKVLLVVVVCQLLVSLALSSMNELSLQEQEQLAKELGTTKLELMETQTKLAMKDADLKVRDGNVDNLKAIIKEKEDQLFWSRIYNIAFAATIIFASSK